MLITDYISREYFLKNSNAKELLIDNLFYPTFVKNNSGEVYNSDSLDLKLASVTGNSDIILYEHLQMNTYGLTLSDQISTTNTQFINADRRNISYKREDKNIQISFIESFDSKIRKIMNEWINMTLPEYDAALYLDDYSVDIIIELLNHKLETKTKIKYEKCYPVSYNNIELSLNNDTPELKLVECEFVYKKQTIIGSEE